MTSAKQIEANRQNAAKSTGPRTVEGKAIAAQNATQHGLTATQTVVVSEIENVGAWETHHAATLDSLQPADYVETIMAGRIAAQLWRLARAVRHEALMIQSAQETVEDDLDARQQLFASTIDATHPTDIRARLRDAAALYRLLTHLPDLPDDAVFKASSAGPVIWAAFDVAEVEENVSLPGVPDDVDYYDLAERGDYTAGQLRACVAAVAAVVGVPAADLMDDMREHARFTPSRARSKAKETERELTHTRRTRTLQLAEATHEKLQRYETALERSLFRNLHELQRLQEQRADGQVPAPVAIDVDVVTDP